MVTEGLPPCVRARQFCTAKMMLCAGIIVKTTIHTICTKGHGEIFNKMIGL
jgi:hypothetical protein